MPREYKAPQAFSDQPRPAIALVPVTSKQIKAVGYDEASQTLAVTFNYGAAIYHYPGISKQTHDDFMQAESVGKYFGAHIQALPFEKFKAEPAPEAETQAASGEAQAA